MWRKKVKLVPLNRTIDISNHLTLSKVDLSIILKPYRLKDQYNGSLTYYEHPEASYNKLGTKQEVTLAANSWSELRDQLDKLLER